MQRLGLTADELRAYHRTLCTSHERRVRLEVQTLSGQVLRSQRIKVIDGGITVDVDAEVSRVLSMTFVDDTQTLVFENQNPSGIPLHRSSRVEVHYEVLVPELDRWVDCVPFSGPIWDLRRSGAEVTLVAHGMDRQGLGNQWQPRTYPKKSRKTKAIRGILADIGFTDMVVPDLGATLPKRLHLLRLDQPLPKAKRLAKSLDRHLFIDSRGIPVVRVIPNRPVFTFDATNMLAPPSIRRDADGIKNVAEVIGGKPKGAKNRVRAEAFLRPEHDLSAQALAFNGQPLHLVVREENAQLKTRVDCQRRVRRLRDDLLRLPIEYGLETVVIPHLDELDLVRVVTDEGPYLVRMKQWNIPLAGSAAGGSEGTGMSVGSLRRAARTGRGRR